MAWAQPKKEKKKEDISFMFSMMLALARWGCRGSGLAYVESKSGQSRWRISAQAEAERRTHAAEEQSVDDGVEEGLSDAAERPTKTAKIAQKCGTDRGRWRGIDTAREIGKNLRVIIH